MPGQLGCHGLITWFDDPWRLSDYPCLKQPHSYGHGALMCGGLISFQGEILKR